MHSAPANLAFSRQALAKILGDIAGFAERLRDATLAGLLISGPVRHAARRVNADNAVRPDTQFAQAFGDAAAFADLADKALSIFIAAHRRSAAGGAPDRCYHRAHDESARLDLFSDPFQAIVIDVDVDVWFEQENIDAIKT